MEKFLDLRGRHNARGIKSFLAKSHITLHGKEISPERAIELIGMAQLKTCIIIYLLESAIET